ncbi:MULTISPECIES: DUF4410 domain-containing protein [unclassified Halomonas]|uniref:DUF4410 domain-containing protein n=1 Tax=unclassified Halomonas TaxID=2609666 RepID=UPI0006D96428|nr:MULTISPECIES: DUF4410 domain-containing protein [unclassified Halomonas]KPQ22660.1 MAG: protein of unknown function containing DUF4410 domain [Halomonas sp. HL-93]SBR45420.1 protein of unknown function (DUF4410) [Halomonas sp. HL-93]SNY98288.1 protein of unknown function [Halomonas sp. hl-4]
MMRYLLIAVVVLLVSGCGSAQVRTDQAAAPLDRYTQFHVDNVDVSSTEKGEKFATLNEEFDEYATSRLLGVIKEAGRFQLATDEQVSEVSTIVAEANIDVTYGSRAKRYWVGFGAGKGTVRSTLVLRDAVSEETLLQLSSDSDLTVGAFGGSMDATIRDNIDELMAELKQQLL